MNNKSIDINQRIPLDTLYAALESYLNGSYSSEYVLEQLKLEFDGENRLKKALRIVHKIIQKNPLNEFMMDYKAELKNAIKKKADRDVILIALLNTAFVFSFDVLKTFGKYFLVQELISRETIKKSLANIYGGNRSTENAIDSVVPMFIEAGLIIRPKLGIFQRNESLQINSPITKKIFIESFRLNNSSEILQEYQLRDPYFLFIGE